MSPPKICLIEGAHLMFLSKPVYSALAYVPCLPRLPSLDVDFTPPLRLPQSRQYFFRCPIKIAEQVKTTRTPTTVFLSINHLLLWSALGLVSSELPVVLCQLEPALP